MDVVELGAKAVGLGVGDTARAVRLDDFGDPDLDALAGVGANLCDILGARGSLGIGDRKHGADRGGGLLARPVVGAQGVEAVLELLKVLCHVISPQSGRSSRGSERSHRKCSVADRHTAIRRSSR